MSELTSVGAVLQKTASGAGWIIAWRAVTRGLGFINTLVLARLLTPADFGLVALAMSFSQAIDALVDLGVSEAVVRAKNPSRAFYDTAFTLNVVRSGATASVLAITAFPIQAFFHEPRITKILYLLAISVFVGGFENIGIADFRRNFAFQSEFQLWVFPRLAQVAVTIAIAAFWPTYWALVMGILTARLLRIVNGYMMHPYRPRLSILEWRQILGFSFWTWLIGMVGLVRNRIIVVVIGRLLDPTMVGTYSLGVELATLPETELIHPLSRVSFSSFSISQWSGTGAAETFVRIVASTLIVILPAGVGIALTADPLVALVFGKKWLAAVPVVQILAIAGILNVISRIGTSLLSAFAYLRSMLGVGLTMLVVELPLSTVLIWYWGILGAAMAAGGAMLIEQTIYCVLVSRKVQVSYRTLLRDIWRCFLAMGVMAIVLTTTGLTRSLDTASCAHLLAVCAAGAMTYAMALWILWLASGWPTGPEADLLEVARRLANYAGAKAALACRSQTGTSRTRQRGR